jgi:hypothetical protein
MIRDMLLLDAEPGFFLDKTLDDLDFINNILAALLDNLVNNKRYIERDEQFHNLTETEQIYGNLLQEIMDGDGAVSVKKFTVIREHIVLLLMQSQERLKNIESFSFSGTESPSFEPVVSSDELNELLKDME